ncbi:MAG: tetratricopeptide repeat protein [Ignavibacteriaceae bacterium]
MKTLKFIALFSFLILFGCSKESDKSYLDTASNNLKNNNITEAVNSYESLIKEYPKSDLVPEALYQLAVIYQNKMVKNLSEKESLQKAVDTYKNVYEKYPKNRRAPMSLFMSAFIMANDLHEFNEATETYNLFLKKYPKDELASSAREELEHMGLTPEEILKKKKSSDI